MHAPAQSMQYILLKRKLCI